MKQQARMKAAFGWKFALYETLPEIPVSEAQALASASADLIRRCLQALHTGACEHCLLH